jgi:hypothetical protein
MQNFDEEYSALESRIEAAIAGSLIAEEDFRVLALDVHAFQRRRNRAYGRYCRQISAPEILTDWREIPAVPQVAFKIADLRCFAAEDTVRTFHTSGTTGEEFGRHHFCSLELYHRAVLRGWEFFGLPALPKVILTPSPFQKPHSSLAEMMDVLPGPAHFVIANDGGLDLVKLLRQLEWQLEAREPVMLLGTALAFLNFFEHCAAEGLRFPLPKGSSALETGGYKGSGRDIPKAELYAKFTEFLDLAPDAVINEYGMTELSSQCYTAGLTRPHGTPPWLRAVIIDPETGNEVAVGETGILRLFDLANLGSVLAIETQDMAIRRENGFELLGRDPGALPRGCSRAADEALRHR